tara:strand:- start:603 stop:860 length:258 start_codon:yes stop_codon:yes gene_type:complete
MKSIIENSTKISKFLFEDSVPVLFGVNKIVVYDSKDPDKIDFYISDLNSSNSTLVENITNSPEDWEGDKYTFDGKDWKEKTSDEE